MSGTSGTKKAVAVVVLFFVRVGVVKVGAFPFVQRKEERRGETLNPKLPTERKKRFYMLSGIDGRERERLRRDAKRERAFHPKTFAAVSFCLNVKKSGAVLSKLF